ncbi:MAG: ABC transporter substrate-binding protein [Thiomargarita sp.]|nr:ABC transporter substrate-binding protein [Thiomargarita sp.]
MKYFKPSITAVLTMGMLFFQAGVWASEEVSEIDLAEAENLIKTTTDDVLADPKRLEDVAEVGKLVDKVFDFRKMSKLVLSKNWKKVTKTQKNDFTNAFHGLLVRTYSKALSEAASTVKQVNYSSKSKKKRILVSVNVETNDSKSINIDYNMYKNKENQWQVYNVSVEGVSLVTTYRSEFANDITTIGIDGLIKKLNDKNEDKKTEE